MPNLKDITETEITVAVDKWSTLYVDCYQGLPSALQRERFAKSLLREYVETRSCIQRASLRRALEAIDIKSAPLVAASLERW